MVSTDGSQCNFFPAAVIDIDTSGIHALEDLYKNLQKRGIQVHKLKLFSFCKNTESLKLKLTDSKYHIGSWHLRFHLKENKISHLEED